MVYDSDRRLTFLFGGAVAGANKNDTWQWDGEDWTQLADSGPSPRFSHAMAFDLARNRTVLFGGISSISPEGAVNVLQDTWEFDGDTWTQQQDAGPPGRGSHAMAYDVSAGRVVLFGGNPARDDTWAWDGKTWVQIAEFGPPGRENAPKLLPIWVLILLAVVITILFHFQSEQHFLASAWACIKTGTAIGAVAVAPFWLILRRGALLSPRMTGATTGLLAGLIGTTGLEIHCPNLEAGHILAAHLGVVLIGALIGYASGLEAPADFAS